MKKIFAPVNIETKLLDTRNKTSKATDFSEKIKKVFKENEQREQSIKAAIKNGGAGDIINTLNIEKLETNRIFHIDTIQKICITYRLRFLDASYFKPAIPFDAIMRIKKLEDEHQTTLNGFQIIAPAKLLKLANADDPLLMVPIGNNYYYLIHKWGEDLHPLRKLAMWPFIKLENFILSLFLISLAFTMMIPIGLFSQEKETTSEFLMMLFFMFKWVAGLAIFYGFKKGKSFSETNWRSSYYNA